MLKIRYKIRIAEIIFQKANKNRQWVDETVNERITERNKKNRKPLTYIL